MTVPVNLDRYPGINLLGGDLSSQKGGHGIETNSADHCRNECKRRTECQVGWSKQRFIQSLGRCYSLSRPWGSVSRLLVKPIFGGHSLGLYFGGERESYRQS